MFACAALVWALAQPAYAQAPSPQAAADYWDLGLRLGYPADWPPPLIIAGQMLFAPDPNAALRGTVTQPVVALRIVDLREMGLPKDASFRDIAIAFNLTDERLDVPNSGDTTLAGMTAGFADLRSNERELSGQSIAFMMPDGRYGLLIGLAPRALWADFAPTFNAMRASARLLRPADYPAPVLGAAGSAAQFAAGGLRYRLPEGWTAREFGASAQIAHAANLVEYADGSGFVSGAQLVLKAIPFAELMQGATPPPITSAPGARGASEARAALVTLLEATPAQAERFREIQVGAGLTGVQFETEDPTTGQRVTFIGLATRGGAVLTVLRWTRPGMLVDVLRPQLDAILASVALD